MVLYQTVNWHVEPSLGSCSFLGECVGWAVTPIAAGHGGDTGAPGGTQSGPGVSKTQRGHLSSWGGGGGGVPPALPLLLAPRVEAAPAAPTLSCSSWRSLTLHKAPRSTFESEKGSERGALTFNLWVSPSTPPPPAPTSPPALPTSRAWQSRASHIPVSHIPASHIPASRTPAFHIPVSCIAAALHPATLHPCIPHLCIPHPCIPHPCIPLSALSITTALDIDPLSLELRCRISPGSCRPHFSLSRAPCLSFPSTLQRG